MEQMEGDQRLKLLAETFDVERMNHSLLIHQNGQSTNDL